MEVTIRKSQWFAHGFTKIAQGSHTGDIDDYHGELTKFADIQPVVALESQDGPIQAEQWQGGSGSVAFDYDTSHIELAIITRYQGGKKLDHLVAVPRLYDMLGNVDEWCYDGRRDYTEETQVDPVGPTDTVAVRVIRGGSWSDSARVVRAAYRIWNHPGVADDDLGFRCASSGK